MRSGNRVPPIRQATFEAVVVLPLPVHKVGA